MFDARCNKRGEINCMGIIAYIKAHWLCVKVFIFSIIVGGVFYSGMSYQQLKYDAQAKAQTEQMHMKYVAEDKRFNSVAAGLEAKKVEREIVYVTIEKEIEKVVSRDIYRNDCIDDDGLRLINESLSGRRTPTSGS